MFNRFKPSSNKSPQKTWGQSLREKLPTVRMGWNQLTYNQTEFSLAFPSFSNLKDNLNWQIVEPLKAAGKVVFAPLMKKQAPYRFAPSSLHGMNHVLWLCWMMSMVKMIKADDIRSFWMTDASGKAIYQFDMNASYISNTTQLQNDIIKAASGVEADDPEEDFASIRQVTKPITISREKLTIVLLDFLVKEFGERNATMEKLVNQLIDSTFPDDGKQPSSPLKLALTLSGFGAFCFFCALCVGCCYYSRQEKIEKLENFSESCKDKCARLSESCSAFFSKCFSRSSSPPSEKTRLNRERISSSINSNSDAGSFSEIPYRDLENPENPPLQRTVSSVAAAVSSQNAETVIRFERKQ